MLRPELVLRSSSYLFRKVSQRLNPANAVGLMTLTTNRFWCCGHSKWRLYKI